MYRFLKRVANAESNNKSTEYRNPEEERYLDYVSRVALPAVKEGNVSYLNSLQRLFTIRDAEHYQIEAATSFLKLTENLSAKKLCQMDESSRGYAEYYWRWGEQSDWKEKWLKREQLQCLSDRQYAAAMCVGTFHSDGYCRQACVESLREWEDSLPYLVLRLNDWVPAVRYSAFASVIYRLSVCGIKELFLALPILDKVKVSGRREQPQLEAIEKEIKQQMRVKFSDCRLCEIHGYEISVKNAVYRFVNQNEVLDQPQLEQLLSLEKSSYGKRLLTQALLSQSECSSDKIRQYLEDKSSVVRYYVMEHYYEKCRAAWDGLERMLMDKTRKVRDHAAYILRKHKGFDVLGFYQEQLGKGKVRIALLGISENGTKKELGIITPYLDSSDNQIKKTALIAYGMLAGESGDMVYLEFLQKPEPLIYIQAYRLIVKYDVQYGAKCIYELYMKYKGMPVADYLLRLLMRERSWKRLPYLLMLCDDVSISDNMKNHIQRAINNRSIYGSISSQEAEVITKMLNEKKNCVPEKTVEGILWDLKFVTR